MKPFKNDLGISENIGVILIVSVAVIGAAIVGISVTSEPTPDEIPNADLIVGYEKIASNNFSINLFHNGGDTLTSSDLDVWAWNGYDQPIEIRKSTISDQFAISDTLSYFCDEEPTRISVLYTGGSSSAMLKSLDLGSKIDPDKLLDSVINDNGSSGDSGGSGGSGGNGEETGFMQYLIDENVFILGKRLHFEGNSVNGPGATVILTDGNLDKSELKSNPDIYVTNIYVNGNVNLPNGDEDLGSPTHPGEIHVSGDLTLKEGQRHIYGTVYVHGDCYLKGPNIHGSMYVDGDLDIGQGSMSIDDDARIYYTGIFTYGSGVPESVISKCIKWPTVPGVQIPDIEIPSLNAADWYTSRGYSSYGTLTSNLKIYAESYTPPQKDQNTAYNVIIIAYNGDISLTHMQGKSLTGVLIAPRGKVTFRGQSFEGVAITRDGFFDEQGGSTVTFKNIGLFIDDPDDYPF